MAADETLKMNVCSSAFRQEVITLRCLLSTHCGHFAPYRRCATMFPRLKHWARAIKRDVVALWLAARDPRVPWYAKAVAGMVAAYALSPIDLIPDFIPVLGYLDDLLIVPLGILVAVELIPEPVMTELRERALDLPSLHRKQAYWRSS